MQLDMDNSILKLTHQKKQRANLEASHIYYTFLYQFLLLLVQKKENWKSSFRSLSKMETYAFQKFISAVFFKLFFTLKNGSEKV